MCSRCDELEDRIAWLESELGIQRNLDLVSRIAATIKDHGLQSKRFGAAKLISALYLAKGRPLTTLQLMEAMPPRDFGEDERLPKIVTVYVCYARKHLGRGIIETIWGKGYRLTDEGVAMVDAILNPQRAAA